MQGNAGSLSNFSLVLVNQLGLPVSGQAEQLSVSMSLFPPPPASTPNDFIQSLVNSEKGSVVVTWNGTAATPSNNSILYQLNVTLKSSGQVGMINISHRIHTRVDRGRCLSL